MACNSGETWIEIHLRRDKPSNFQSSNCKAKTRDKAYPVHHNKITEGALIGVELTNVCAHLTKLSPLSSYIFKSGSNQELMSIPSFYYVSIFSFALACMTTKDEIR